MHTDDSDVTFNVCLGDTFTGATLAFCGMMGAPDHRKLRHVYNHEIGSISLSIHSYVVIVAQGFVAKLSLRVQVVL